MLCGELLTTTSARYKSCYSYLTHLYPATDSLDLWVVHHGCCIGHGQLDQLITGIIKPNKNGCLFANLVVLVEGGSVL